MRVSRRDLALALAWAAAAYLIGHIRIHLPGTRTLYTDLVEAVLIASAFHLRRPWLCLVPCAAQVANLPEGETLWRALRTTAVMHAIAVPVAWYAHRALVRRRLDPVRLGLSWVAAVVGYYLLVLMPAMLAANVAFLGYPLAKVPGTYLRILDAWRFELMFTAGVTSLWLVAKEELARRRRAERSLQDAFDAQRALVDAAPIAIVGVTAGGVVSTWNPAAAALFGRAAAEAVGDAAPALHGAGDAPVIDVVLGGEVLARTEGEALLSGGSRVPIAISGAPVRDPAGAVLLVEDLRERRSLEAAVERAASMSALGQLVGGVAHELRNPLFGISATLDAFARELAGNPKLQLMDRTLRGQLEQLQSLMHDLLAYGRAGLGERAEASVELPLGHALRDCEAQAAAAQVDVEVALPPDLPAVSINAAQIQQALRNLIQNAIAFSPPGGAVRIEGQREDHDGRALLRLDVLDRGRGFAPDDLPRVFEPFFSRRHGGTGLGLAIVQHVVERHGGTVAAGNRPDGGARVVVRLPAYPAMG